MGMRRLLMTRIRKFLICLLISNVVTTTTQIYAAEPQGINEKSRSVMIEIDAEENIKKTIAACFVKQFRKIPYLTFVNHYGFDPVLNTYAPRFVFKVIARQIDFPHEAEKMITVSIVIHRPFANKEVLNILNSSTTTGQPLFGDDVMLALTTLTNELNTFKVHRLYVSKLRTIDDICQRVIEEFDSTILEQDREAIRSLSNSRIRK
jgi:hypothetical protein